MAPLFGKMPVFSPLRDVPGLFQQVCVDPGGYGISWNDDIDLDASELWENGVPAVSPFDGFLSFADATALWALNESTLRKAISYRKLVPVLMHRNTGSSGSSPVPPWNGNTAPSRKANRFDPSPPPPPRGRFLCLPLGEGGPIGAG